MILVDHFIYNSLILETPLICFFGWLISLSNACQQPSHHTVAKKIDTWNGQVSCQVVATASPPPLSSFPSLLSFLFSLRPSAPPLFLFSRYAVLPLYLEEQSRVFGAPAMDWLRLLHGPAAA